MIDDLPLLIDPAAIPAHLGSKHVCIEVVQTGIEPMRACDEALPTRSEALPVCNTALRTYIASMQACIVAL